MGIKKQLLFLLLLIALLLIAQVILYAGGWRTGISPVVTTTPATAVRIPPPPILTASDTVAEEAKHPFSQLISYVDTGFEPVTTHVRVGQTTRFINNSTHELWVVASGATLYPRTQDGCGSSDLDSCAPLKPGEFWQFTFAKKGTWQYVNNLDKTKQGTVIVQ